MSNRDSRIGQLMTEEQEKRASQVRELAEMTTKTQDVQRRVDDAVNGCSRMSLTHLVQQKMEQHARALTQLRALLPFCDILDRDPAGAGTIVFDLLIRS